MRSRLRLVACAFFLLTICATLHAQQGLWLDVPYIHQEKDGCGSASVAMLMQYWIGKHADIPAQRSDPKHIQRELYSRSAHGIYASAIQAYLRESGLDVFAFRGEWKDLREQIAKGRPLLVGLQPGSGRDLHYVVVVGVSPEDASVVVNDPARSKLMRVDRARFLSEWQGTNRWTLLAVPKQTS